VELAACEDADLVVVSCFPFDAPDQVRDLANATADTPLAIDPNPRAGMMHDPEEFVRGFELLAAGSRLVKVGDDDARLLFGAPLDALRDRLVELGAEVVLATYGAAGAALDTVGVAVTAPISKLPGAIVDTMGAGDAVLAAIAASLVQDSPEGEDEWDAALHRAMDVAAATCRFEGGLLRLPSALESDDAVHDGS
jgi:fructokinase